MYKPKNDAPYPIDLASVQAKFEYQYLFSVFARAPCPKVDGNCTATGIICCSVYEQSDQEQCICADCLTKLLW
jgi:hypothetical protein